MRSEPVVGRRQFTYSYDNNGNLTTKTNKTTSAVTTYHWDAQDQLSQIDRPDSTTITYYKNMKGSADASRRTRMVPSPDMLDGKDSLLSMAIFGNFRHN